LYLAEKNLKLFEIRPVSWLESTKKIKKIDSRQPGGTGMNLKDTPQGRGEE
jgi:hypothetical protein